MPNLREVTDALLKAYDFEAIDDVEFALLYDLNTSKNLEIPQWQYAAFNLKNMHEDECKAEYKCSRNTAYKHVISFASLSPLFV